MNRIPLLFAAISVIFACSDSSVAPAQNDASVPDSGTTDPTLDAATPADAGTDVASKPFIKPTPFAIPLSAAGPDQLQSAAAGPNGTFYAAGYAAETVSGAKLITVVKMTPTGLDTTFGKAGIATTNLAFAGGAGEIEIAVQPSGKLVLSATVANAVDPADRDVAVMRLDASGALDTSFGVSGVRILDLNTAIDASQASQRDAARGVALGAGGEIYVHAATRGDGARTDSDFAIVKLTVDGALDTTFNTTGKFTLDFGSPSANATPRGVRVLSDGSVLGSGYASSSISANTAQVVLFKLSPTGVLVPGFADNGIFHSVVLSLQTEAYHVAIHGSDIVTGGYGRNTGTTNDWVSLRFNATTGVRDTKWGGAPDGAVVFDPSGKALGSNCRNAIALPSGKTLLLGSTGPSNVPTQDAAFAVLDANGVLDKAYGTGITVLPFGVGEGGNDQFWGAAVSGPNVLVVGYKGGGASQTDTMNDDAYGVIFPIQ